MKPNTRLLATLIGSTTLLTTSACGFTSSNSLDGPEELQEPKYWDINETFCEDIASYIDTDIFTHEVHMSETKYMTEINQGCRFDSSEEDEMGSLEVVIIVEEGDVDTQRLIESDKRPDVNLFMDMLENDSEESAVEHDSSGTLESWDDYNTWTLRLIGDTFESYSNNTFHEMLSIIRVDDNAIIEVLIKSDWDAIPESQDIHDFEELALDITENAKELLKDYN